MHDLPPLNALRAFEVAARSGSFVQAGAELGVTAAAVSLQVRHLEQHLGKQLFLRRGNRLTLTDAGRAVYPRLEQALAEIAALARGLRGGAAAGRLVLSCLPSVAELWLMPRLAGFAGAGRLDIRVADDPVDLAREGVDLRIGYGAHFYAGQQVAPLFTGMILPVAAPGVCDAFPDVPDAGLIHTGWGAAYATAPDWGAWFAPAGRRPDTAQGLQVGGIGPAVAAACAGLGVALVPEQLAAADLAAGRLRALSDDRIAMARPYVLAWPEARTRSRALQALAAHLLG